MAMGRFSERAAAIKPTGVRRMFDMAQGEIISFGLVEPDFQPPPVAIEAFHQAMLEGHNKYTTTSGHPELRNRIARTWDAHLPGLDERHVCMTMSGTNALMNCYMALLDPGDQILIPEPYFPLYGPDATLVGAEGVLYPCRFEHRFVPQVADLEALVTSRTKAILYNFPSNPTGATLNLGERDALLEFARAHDLWIISDEVYDRIIYEGPHVSFLGAGYDSVIVVNSFSKTFAMTGWRIGYLISGDLEAMGQITKMQYYMTACSNDAMQRALIVTLDEAMDYPAEMASEFQARRDLICERLNAMEGVTCHVPQGAFYVFPKVEVPGRSSEEVAMAMLEGGVLCTPGSAFGPSGEGHLRFAYTISRADISRGMDKVEEVLARLRSEAAA